MGLAKTKLKVAFKKVGLKQNGEQWVCFTCAKTKKDQETGRYYNIITYKIYVENHKEVNFNDGDYVEIDQILDIDYNKGEYLGKPYQNIVLNVKLKTNNRPSREEYDSILSDLERSISGNDIRFDDSDDFSNIGF
jgi:hypothetical protein